MSESFTEQGSASTAKRCAASPRGASECTAIHVRAARGIWPRKTAENWAAAAGKKPRIAKHWISTGDVSDAGKLALLRLLG